MKAGVVRISQAIPILASLDIERSLSFFEKNLNFSVKYFRESDYGIAKRDDIEVHFWLCKEKHIAENTSCYIRVHGIHALRSEWIGSLPDLQDVVRTTWGTDELYIFDPDGNLLRLGEEVE